MNRKYQLEQIEKRVFEGIRKTINRFQENPFHFFTEADIHTSLANDIMFGKSENGTTKKNVLTTTEDEDIGISLVHQEYPTYFRYVKKKLLDGYKDDEDITRIDFNLEDGRKHGDRGNYDLSILDPLFISKMFKKSEEKQITINPIVIEPVAKAGYTYEHLWLDDDWSGSSTPHPSFTVGTNITLNGYRSFDPQETSVESSYWAYDCNIIGDCSTPAEEWEDPDSDGVGSVKIEEVEGASKSTFMGIEVDNGNDNALGGGTGSLTATFHF